MCYQFKAQTDARCLDIVRMQPIVQRSVNGDQVRSGEVQLIADVDTGPIADANAG